MIIAIGLYQGFTALDAIGPYEVLTCLPGAEVVICGEHTGLFDDQYHLLHLRIDTTLSPHSTPALRRRRPNRSTTWRLPPSPNHNWVRHRLNPHPGAGS